MSFSATLAGGDPDAGLRGAGAYHRVIGSSLIMTVVLLCFIMGLQNAMITKVSNSVSAPRT